MRQPTPETSSETPSVAREQTPAQTAAEAARRADLELKMAQEETESQLRAAELAEDLKQSKIEKVVTVKKPLSEKRRFWGGLGKLGVGAVGPGVAKGVKQIGYGFSGIFTAIENAGHQTLKQYESYLKWIPFLGPWLLKKPEKSWKEQDEEDAKKKEAEAKKTEAKNKAQQKLEKKYGKDRADELIAAQEVIDTSKLGDNKTEDNTETKAAA